MEDAKINTERFYGTDSTEAVFVPPSLRSTKKIRKAIVNSKARKNRHVHRWTFPTQEQAFLKADETESCDTLYVWAREIDGNGRRRYIVASLSSLWQWYRRVLRRGMDFPVHAYEVIREGRKCKAYFDLEFRYDDHKATPLDGNALVSEVVSVVRQVIDEWTRGEFGSLGDVVVDLDSTSPSKFSRHLIFPNVVFQNNGIAGVFAHECERRLSEAARAAGFVDLSVYSKNRCFRLLGSSKFGKQYRLLPQDCLSLNSGIASSASRISVAPEAFFRSVVTNVPNGAHVIPCPTELAVSTVMPSNSASICLRPPQLGPQTTTTYGGASNAWAALDSYVKRIVEPHRGAIYTVSHSPASFTLAYAIKGGYRYCARIGRHHRSNNVILVADLRCGTMHQRCFDPDCRGYRSEPWKIPPQLLTGQGDHEAAGFRQGEDEQSRMGGRSTISDRRERDSVSQCCKNLGCNAEISALNAEGKPPEFTPVRTRPVDKTDSFGGVPDHFFEALFDVA